MLVGNYLDELLDSKVAVRLVRALITYHGRIFTIRKLAEVAGTSASEAAVAVKDLERHGVVVIQPVGRAHLVSLNHLNYVVSTILKPMIAAEEKTLAELVSILRKHLKNKAIVSVSLFGSVPSGNARVDSDVDLLVISDDLESAAVAVSNAQSGVASIFNARLSPLIMGTKELRDKIGNKFLKSIQENHVHVAGKFIEEFTGYK